MTIKEETQEVLYCVGRYWGAPQRRQVRREALQQISLRAVDVGFDVRSHGHVVRLPGVGSSLIAVQVDDLDLPLAGCPSHVAAELGSRGYTVRVGN